MTSTDIQNLIVSTASAYGVDPRLALEVAMQESNLDQSAVSSAGAIGIFQLMPATAAELGVDPTDPTQNIQGGVHYLAQLLGEFGDVSQALGAYNWGPGNVQNAVAQYGAGWIYHAPAETQDYVLTIMGNVGSQYTVSVGTPPASSIPIPGLDSTAVNQAGVLPGNLSITEILWIAGLGLLGVFVMGMLE